MSRPVLSIIIPSYNHCKFLPERLNSIYAQHFQDFELIILDDASSDGSVELIKKLLKGKDYTLIVNIENSGSPFRQWEKGLQLAKGDFVWIAESDDSCSPAFISSIFPDLVNGNVSLAFTRTLSIDGTGITKNSDYWPELFNRPFFAETQLISCHAFLHSFLSARNCIPNVSSVIFSINDAKREVIKAAQHAARFSFAGDWVFWARLVFVYGKKNMLYVCDPLCLHRDHGNTTRVVLDRHAESLRVREYSKALHQIHILQGLLAPWSSFRALSGGWWDWSYEQYLSRYKPFLIERLVGYPQSGIHLIGYWLYRIRRFYRNCQHVSVPRG